MKYALFDYYHGPIIRVSLPSISSSGPLPTAL